MNKPTIIVIGLGWSSVGFITHIDTNKYNVEVYSPDNKFVYTPLLAQNIKHNKVLTLDGSDINNRIQYKNREIKNIEFNNNKIVSNNNEKNEYNYLILSHGASTNTFNIKGVEDFCYFLKNSNDADIIKTHLKTLNNNANIAVIGCGLTGSEVIGTLLDYNKFNIHAIDALSRPINMFSEKLSNMAINLWKENNVNIYMNQPVSSIDKQQINFKENPSIKYDLAIWCGGIKKSPLTETILNILNIKNKKGIPVDEYFRVNTCNNVWAIGDCADYGLPPTAQVGYQEGKYLAQRFNNNFKSNKFKFNNKGQIGYIGLNKSVCQLPYFSSGGNLVYYLNTFIHLYNTVNMKQKINFLKN